MEKKILKKIIIFDVDGVLIDSKLNMKKSWISVQKKFGLKKTKFKDYFSKIGLPFEKILEQLSIHSNHKEIKKCYDNTSVKNVRLIKFYKHTKKELKKLYKMDFVLCIVTSKDLKRTKLFLKELKNLFTTIQAPQKNLNGKPYPDQINNVIKKLKAKKKDCVYIGDTNIDYIAAKSAGIDFIFADWGYGINKKFKSIKNIKNIKSIIKLPNY